MTNEEIIGNETKTGWDLEREVLAVEALASYMREKTEKHRKTCSDTCYDYKDSIITFTDSRSKVKVWCQTKEEFALALSRVSYFATGHLPISFKTSEGVMIKIGGGDFVTNDEDKPYNDISEAFFIGIGICRSRFHRGNKSQ